LPLLSVWTMIPHPTEQKQQTEVVSLAPLILSSWVLASAGESPTSNEDINRPAAPAPPVFKNFLLVKLIEITPFFLKKFLIPVG
jgi:hypothetical protein